MVVLDLETTGGSPAEDRITEIAAIRLQDGVEVARINQLINPGRPIPPYIQKLTGISDAMVAQAPDFASVIPQVQTLLQGAVLVAHNVRFDHGFLVQEFARAGHTLSVQTLCSVRLSRALYPQYKGHGLDAIMARHGLQTDSRHRAMSDVVVVLQWLASAEQQLGSERIRLTAHNLLQGSAYLPPNLQTPLANIPSSHGVYAFYGEHQELLLTGKSSQLRRRVLAQFQSASQDKALQAILDKTYRLHWQETAGELGALLVEQQLRRGTALTQQRPQHHCLWRLCSDANTPTAWPQIQLMQAHDGLHSSDVPYLYGPWRSKRQALETLRTLADRHRLCLHALGLESAKGPCSAHDRGLCLGCCVGLESRAAHWQRLRDALAKDRLHAWPWPQRLLAYAEQDDIHLFDQWCYIGTLCQTNAASPASWQSAAYALYRQTVQAGSWAAFDLDIYRELTHRIPGVLSPMREAPHLHLLALPPPPLPES